MAAVKVFSIVIFCAVLFTAVHAQGGPQAGQGLLDNPFIPQWVPCNYTEIQGATCQDCNTVLICTKVGGIVRPCWGLFRPNCVNGRCVSQPSEECAAPPPPPPPPTTTEPPTAEPSTTPDEPSTSPEGSSTTPEGSSTPEESSSAPEEPEE